MSFRPKPLQARPGAWGSVDHNKGLVQMLDKAAGKGVQSKPGMHQSAPKKVLLGWDKGKHCLGGARTSTA